MMDRVEPSWPFQEALEFVTERGDFFWSIPVFYMGESWRTNGSHRLLADRPFRGVAIYSANPKRET